MSTNQSYPNNSNNDSNNDSISDLDNIFKILDSTVESFRDEIVETTCKLINFESVLNEHEPPYPFGKANNDALVYMLNLAENAGFAVQSFDGYAGLAQISQGTELISVPVHLDVVPAGDGWTSDPFTAVVSAGNIIGRGASDNKGPAAAAFYAIKALKTANFALSKRIGIILGVDEESDFRCAEYYLKHGEIPVMSLVPDADFPVTNIEKGLYSFSIKRKMDNVQYSNDSFFEIVNFHGGERSNIVPSSCEMTIRSQFAEIISQIFDAFLQKTGYNMTLTKQPENIIRIESRGVLAHASVPHLGKNAISQTMMFINELNKHSSIPKPLPKWICDYSNYFNKHPAPYYRIPTGENTTSNANHGDELTYNCGIIKIENGHLVSDWDIRYPSSTRERTLTLSLQTNAAQHGLTFVKTNDYPPLHVNEDAKVVIAALNTYNDFFNTNQKPVSIGFGTYSRFFPNSVGFGPNFPGEEKIAHKSDEFISIESLVIIAKLYARALYSLAK